MTFEEWITKWCECDKFEHTEQYFSDLEFNNMNTQEDMLSYMEEAFVAGVESTKENTYD